MKTEPNYRPLLDDVLSSDATDRLRGEILALTLNRVRQRKRTQSWSRGLIAAGTVGSLLLALLLRPPSPDLKPEQTRTPGTQSGSIQPSWIVSTQPLDPAQTVLTRPGSLEVVSTRARSVEMVETPIGRPSVEELNDQELIDFFGDRPVILVKHRPGRAELFFGNPEDADGFPVP